MCFVYSCLEKGTFVQFPVHEFRILYVHMILSQLDTQTVKEEEKNFCAEDYSRKFSSTV